MNRRSFLGILGGMIGGVVIDQAIPLGRVWSFPSNIVVPEISLEPAISLNHLATFYYNRQALDLLKKNFKFRSFCEA